jgi:predicted PurR-regulated permease PerM
MSTVLPAVLAVCAVVLTLVIAAVFLELRRLVARAESVLGMLEQELRPVIGEVRQLGEELRHLTRDAEFELQQLGALAEHLTAILGGVGGLIGALGAVQRVSQLAKVAVGLKRGVDAFVQRLRKGQG